VRPKPEYSMKMSNEIKIVFENPCSQAFAFENNNSQALLEEMMKNHPYNLTLSLEELLAPRQQKIPYKPPRAKNKFILYRTDYIARARKENPKRVGSMTTRDLSKEASESWKAQPAAVKQLFTVLAKVASERHKE
ncbi:16767_t:CDS:1, partial [Racocetra persica]